jgi:GNAT superfamily N-acetyltransferase
MLQAGIKMPQIAKNVSMEISELSRQMALMAQKPASPTQPATASARAPIRTAEADVLSRLLSEPNAVTDWGHEKPWRGSHLVIEGEFGTRRYIRRGGPDNAIVAALLVGKGPPSLPKEKQKWQILSMYTKPEWRRKGLMTRLLQWAQADLGKLEDASEYTPDGLKFITKAQGPKPVNIKKVLDNIPSQPVEIEPETDIYARQDGQVKTAETRINQAVLRQIEPRMTEIRNMLVDRNVANNWNSGAPTVAVSKARMVKLLDEILAFVGRNFLTQWVEGLRQQIATGKDYAYATMSFANLAGILEGKSVRETLASSKQKARG